MERFSMRNKGICFAASLMRLALSSFRGHSEGFENLPKDGAFIAAANHQSYMDGPLLALEFLWAQKRPLHLVAYEEPFRNWFFGYFLRRGRCIPFRRGDAEDTARMMGIALAYALRGEAIGIFPEGHMNPRARLAAARSGMAILVLMSGCPVVPVGILGTDGILPAGRGLVWRKVFSSYAEKARIRVGNPLTFQEESAAYQKAVASDDQEKRAKIVRETTERVMESIGQLCGKGIQ
jgi:1-acyl-sn-glycerol-3-phosphate acyltransferase